MEKKLYGVLMAFGATEAAMNNDDFFENGKNYIENDLFNPKMTSNLPKMPISAPKWYFWHYILSKIDFCSKSQFIFIDFKLENDIFYTEN